MIKLSTSGIPEAVEDVLRALKVAIPGMEYGIDEEGTLVIKVDDEGIRLIENVKERTDIPWLEEVLRSVKILRIRARAPGGEDRGH